MEPDFKQAIAVLHEAMMTEEMKPLFQFQINPIGRCFALPCYSTVCGFAPTLGLIWKRNSLPSNAIALLFFAFSNARVAIECEAQHVGPRARHILEDVMRRRFASGSPFGSLRCFG